MLLLTWNDSLLSTESRKVMNLYLIQAKASSLAHMDLISSTEDPSIVPFQKESEVGVATARAARAATRSALEVTLSDLEVTMAEDRLLLMNVTNTP